MAILSGSKLRDRLAGTSAGDIISARSGNDIVSGLGGDDRLSGEAGSDYLYGQAGDDVLAGGDGNDKLFGGLGTDRLIGEAGNDSLDGGESGDRLYGGAGYDTAVYVRSKQAVSVNLTTGATSGGDAAGDQLSSIESVNGSNQADSLTGSAAGNVLAGFGGNDTISGLAGNDVLDGGIGNDQLLGGENDDLMAGGAGNDQLLGGAGDDILRPGAGSDTINGGTGYNTLDYSDAAGGVFLLLETATTGGAAFGDTFSNIQKVIGSALNDVITASASGAPETIDGWAGDDTLIANQADGERLIGGFGNDQLIAAADSADEFQLQRGRGADYITGFDATNATLADRDTLVINGAEFGIGSALDPSELVTLLDGAGPQFLQSLSGGNLYLYFDADGVAATHGLVLVASLAGGGLVSVGDFLVI